MELGVGTLFSTSAGSVSGAGVGDVLVDDSRDGALREGSKPWAADKRTIGRAAAWSDPAADETRGGSVTPREDSAMPLEA